MESFAVQHSGSIAVNHNVLLDCSPNVVKVVRDFTKLAIVVVVGLVAASSVRLLVETSRGTSKKDRD